MERLLSAPQHFPQDDHVLQGHPNSRYRRSVTHPMPSTLRARSKSKNARVVLGIRRAVADLARPLPGKFRTWIRYSEYAITRHTSWRAHLSR
jgi:hypothetical protein